MCQGIMNNPVYLCTLYFVLGQLTRGTGFGMERNLFLLCGLRALRDGPGWPKRVGRILSL
jgi:hypothetical protein